MDPPCVAVGRNVDAMSGPKASTLTSAAASSQHVAPIGSAIRAKPRACPVAEALTRADASAVSQPSASSPQQGSWTRQLRFLAVAIGADSPR